MDERNKNGNFRRGLLKVNAVKTKMIVLGEEKELVCEEASVDGRQLEHIEEFKYLCPVFD